MHPKLGKSWPLMCCTVGPENERVFTIIAAVAGLVGTRNGNQKSPLIEGIIYERGT